MNTKANIDYAALIERANKASRDAPAGRNLFRELTDAIERLIAERDAWEENCKYHMRLANERNALQEQVKVLRKALDLIARYTKEYSPKGYVAATAEEALALTAPKGESE